MGQDQTENASDIEIILSNAANDDKNVTIAVDSLSLNEDIDFTKRYGSGNNKPTGRSTGHFDAGGSFTVMGLEKSVLNYLLFDENGHPKKFTISITHPSGLSTGVTGCKVESRGYEISDGEMSETSYDFDAFDIKAPRSEIEE